MKRVVSSKSGKDIYGPKWQNIESSSSTELERDDELHSTPLESTGTAQIPVSVTEAAKPESPTITSHGEHNENQIPKGKIVGSLLGESMYRAALEGDWVAAEVLLEQDSNLARDYVTEEGDRALHVAASMKRTIFVHKLVERISNASDLELLDGRGCTACCYAAISGAIKIAHIMIKKNPNLATAQDMNKKTPLHKAAFHGNKKMVSYFLECSKVGDLSRQDCFDLLLVTIRSGMYDSAIKILIKNGSIATMADEEGTALHLLARRARRNFVQSARDHFVENDYSDFDKLVEELKMGKSGLLDLTEKSQNRDFEKSARDDEDDENDYRSDFDKLAEDLWVKMQEMEKSSLLELIKKPRNILHDATKEGRVRIIIMLIRTYPQLIREIDSNGYTLFHTAVKRGDNILHLAAKLAPPNVKKLHPALQMQIELRWFETVEAILPPSCVMMRNNDNLRPRDLFSEQHKTLLNNSEMWMRNMADSCILIATILFSVMFAAAFTVPGGYDPQTGEPIFAKRHWFKVFVVFEVLGLIASVFSIVVFRSIMASNFTEEDFVIELQVKQMMAFQALLWSLVCAFSAFMSSIALFNMKMNGLVWFGFFSLYFVGAFWLLVEIFSMMNSIRINRSIPLTSTRLTIFNQYPTRPHHQIPRPSI
ncbi:hypothetical protein C2S51_018470 [Perilla frutescens var. frutescens]|nr:hypothetical protein C2S51_018470 [Perilla frutescens var. frutescens]